MCESICCEGTACGGGLLLLPWSVMRASCDVVVVDVCVLKQLKNVRNKN